MLIQIEEDRTRSDVSERFEEIECVWMVGMFFVMCKCPFVCMVSILPKKITLKDVFTPISFSKKKQTNKQIALSHVTDFMFM